MSVKRASASETETEACFFALKDRGCGSLMAKENLRLTRAVECGILYMLQTEHIQKKELSMSGENYSEKVSVNLNTSTLSSIDILVDNGYYSNRSDFINQAVREKLQAQQSVLDRIIQTEDIPDNPWFLGVTSLSPEELERLKKAGKTQKIRGYGLLLIPESIDDALVFEMVESIRVKGRVRCSAAVRAHYGIK